MKKFYLSVLFSTFAIIYCAYGQQSDDLFANINFRQSVFTEDLNHVFVFRKENLGNVFVYDVINNTMIQEVEIDEGTILEVIPRNSYFIIIGSESMYLYSLETFQRLNKLLYNYTPVGQKSGNSVSVSNSVDASYSFELPLWLQVEAKLSGDLLYCKWKDGHVKVWNWKTNQMLREFDLPTKTQFNITQVNGNVAMGSDPTRLIVREDNKVTVYDSDFQLVNTNTVKGEGLGGMYFNDNLDQVILSYSDFNLASRTSTITSVVYDQDMRAVIDQRNMTIDFSQDEFQTYLTETDEYEIYMVTQTYKTLEDQYKALNPNLKKISIIDKSTGNEARSISGEFVSISNDGSRMIMKRVNEPLPPYEVDRYKSFFKKRANSMTGNRYYYNYKNKVDALSYHVIVDISSGRDIKRIDTKNPVYFYNTDYILENSPLNGGLKLYDYGTANLIKEL